MARGTGFAREALARIDAQVVSVIAADLRTAVELGVAWACDPTCRVMPRTRTSSDQTKLPPQSIELCSRTPSARQESQPNPPSASSTQSFHTGQHLVCRSPQEPHAPCTMSGCTLHYTFVARACDFSVLSSSACGTQAAGCFQMHHGDVAKRLTWLTLAGQSVDVERQLCRLVRWPSGLRGSGRSLLALVRSAGRDRHCGRPSGGGA